MRKQLRTLRIVKKARHIGTNTYITWRLIMNNPTRNQFLCKVEQAISDYCQGITITYNTPECLCEACSKDLEDRARVAKGIADYAISYAYRSPNREILDKDWLSIP
jgi:hypothetical protein